MWYNGLFSRLSLSVSLKPRLHFTLHVLDGPVGELFLRHGALDLFGGEALGLGGRVVAQTRDLADLLVRDRGGGLAVGALVDGHDDGAAKAQVVLQAVFGVLDQAVVRPAAEVPGQFGALSEAGGTWVGGEKRGDVVSLVNGLREKGKEMKKILGGGGGDGFHGLPRGWPFEIKPPDGLTTYFPPYVMPPARTSSWALPLGDRPMASMTHISLALKQS